MIRTEKIAESWRVEGLASRTGMIRTETMGENRLSIGPSKQDWHDLNRKDGREQTIDWAIKAGLA